MVAEARVLMWNGCKTGPRDTLVRGLARALQPGLVIAKDRCMALAMRMAGGTARPLPDSVRQQRRMERCLRRCAGASRQALLPWRGPPG